MHCWIWMISCSSWCLSLKLYFWVKMVLSFDPKYERNSNFQDRNRVQKLLLHCHSHLSEAGESRMLLIGIELVNGHMLCVCVYVCKSKRVVNMGCIHIILCARVTQNVQGLAKRSTLSFVWYGFLKPQKCFDLLTTTPYKYKLAKALNLYSLSAKMQLIDYSLNLIHEVHLSQWE